MYALGRCIEFNSEQPLLEQVNHIIIFVLCEIRIEPPRYILSFYHGENELFFFQYTIYIYIFVPSTHASVKSPRILESNNDDIFPIIHRIDLWLISTIISPTIKGKTRLLFPFFLEGTIGRRRFIAPMATSESWSTCNWPRSIVTSYRQLAIARMCTLLWKPVRGCWKPNSINHRLIFCFRFNRLRRDFNREKKKRAIKICTMQTPFNRDNVVFDVVKKWLFLG